MKKVVFMGAIASFCDLYYDTDNTKYKVIACDYYKNAPLKKIVDCSYDVSTTDLDKMTEVLESNNADGIVTAFSDRNLMPGYQLATKMGLPTLYTKELIQLLTNKIEMKKHLIDHGFPVIPYRIIDREFTEKDLEGIVFPVVVKPVDGYGSKGILVCNNIEEVRQNFEKASVCSDQYKQQILVEEFYPVDEISISAWVHDGKSYLTSTYDVGRNFGESVLLSSVCFPSKYNAEHLGEFEVLMQQLVTCFGVKEGPVTIQCYIGDRGLRIGEFIFRLTGGSAYRYSSILGGPNTAQMLLDYVMGDPVDYQNLFTYRIPADRQYYEVQVYSSKAGMVRHNLVDEEVRKNLSEVIKCSIYCEDGSLVDQGQVVARFYCQVPSAESKSYEDMLKTIADYVKLLDEQGNDCADYHYPERGVNRIPYEFRLAN